MTSRRVRIAAVVLGGFVFLGIALLVARALDGAGAERAEIADIVRAQARGDADGVLARMPACRADRRCARLVRERTARLKRSGDVQILHFQPSVQMALSNHEGPARVAWRTDAGSLPVVQCVYVRREGPLSGGRVEIFSISGPVGLEAACG